MSWRTDVQTSNQKRRPVQSAQEQNKLELRESVNTCVDSTVLHVSRDLLAFRPARAHDHSNNALALAQVCPKTRVAFDMVAERR